MNRLVMFVGLSAVVAFQVCMAVSLAPRPEMKSIDIHGNVTGLDECFATEDACEKKCTGMTVTCYKFQSCNGQSAKPFGCAVSPGVIWAIAGGVVLFFLLIGCCVLVLCCCCPACLLAKCIAG